MNKFRIKDISFMAISIALMYVFGKILYILSRFLPIPGSRVLFTAPLFTFVMTTAVLRSKKIGTISIIMGLLALILTRFTIFGGLSILLSGLLTDLTTFILIKKYTSYRSVYLTIGLHGFYSMWTSFFVVSIFIENSSFVTGAWYWVLIISIFLYLICSYISKMTIKLLDRRKLLDNNTLSIKD